MPRDPNTVPLSAQSEDWLEPRYREAYTAWRDAPGPETSGRLLHAVRPVISASLRSYAPKGGPLMQARARAIVLDALPKYDPRQAGLGTYLDRHLQGLRRHAGARSRVVRMPERVALDRAYLDRVRRELRDELSREPSDTELADRSGLSPKRLAHIRTFQPGLTESQATTVSTLDPEGGPSDPAVLGLDPWEQRVRFLMPDLDPVDQAIVERRFGLGGHTPQRPSAVARALNLSPAAISQRAARIQAKLDALEDVGLF